MPSPSDGPRKVTDPQQETPFTLAKKAAISLKQKNECHRAVTVFIVKGMLPFCTVESKWFREMTGTLNPKYSPPSRELLTDTLIPAWYNVEKENVKMELSGVDHIAVTADGWSSIAQDHYITVTAHYIAEGQLKDKVLHTRAVYVSQTGPVVAEEIGNILDEFGVKSKVVAITVDNASNMDVAVRTMELLKMPCFAHTLNIAAQKVYNVKAVSNWAARIRSVVVWLRRNNLAKVVLKEKRRILHGTQSDEQCHAVILDIRTRWNSLYLMVERFLEMYPVIQAALMDPRLKRAIDRDRVERVSTDDLQRCEDFISTTRVLHTSTLCVSADKSATAGQILPILEKVKQMFMVNDDDSPFKRALKETVWKDLEPRYTDEANYKLQRFLEEATALDPRFKAKVKDEAVWTRLIKEAVELQLVASRNEVGDGAEPVVTHQEEGVKEEEELELEEEELETEAAAYLPALQKKKKLSALGELFEEEDQALLEEAEVDNKSALSIEEKAKMEVQEYRSFKDEPTKVDPIKWWDKRDRMPMLSNLAKKYLCVQASSTPSERVFSTAGDTVSIERARLLPEKVDMLVFLKKNC